MGKDWRTKYLSLAHIILSRIKANELYPTGTSFQEPNSNHKELSNKDKINNNNIKPS